MGTRTAWIQIPALSRASHETPASLSFLPFATDTAGTQRCVLGGSGSHHCLVSLWILQELWLLEPLLTVPQLRGQYLCLPGPR